ncbi:MAG: hypothetical protein A2Y07_09820 [Planctomycetes bacterium GWF2_50_10]|nr:MAG: hypothetical protein A2Y07_09820 [Planctomycetes bacterium GWF2_50_10]
MGMWITLIIILCGTSLFLSIGATSLRIFNRVKLQQACEKLGQEERLGKILESSHEVATVCSFWRLAINFAILLLLLAMLTVGDDRVAAMDFVISFAIAMGILLIFSLAIPHAVARYVGERFLARTWGLLKLVVMLSWPVLMVVRAYDLLVRRLAGVAMVSGEEAQEQREEQFLNVVEQGKMEGVVDEEEQEMIENVLELSDITAQQIMTPRTDVVAIEAKLDFEGVLKAIATGHSRIPVFENTIDNIIGFIYAKDMLNLFGQDTSSFDMRKYLRPAYFVPETKLLRVLLHEFQAQKLHIAVVLDEYGGTAGLVTIEDILEELVGEIADEYEELPAENINKIDENAIEVDARIRIDEVNSEFEIELPEDQDYDTLGGFIFSHLGYIPKTGESFEWDSLKFTITSAEARKINRVKMRKIARQE